MKKKFGAILIALVLVVALAIPMAGVVGANGNLIVNGDFEAGNTGFTSEYTYEPYEGHSTLWQENEYAIGTDPYAYHALWSSFGDHTTGIGKMMIVNGTPPNPSPNLVWAQEVTLPVCDPVSTYPLYAGQTMLVGDVLVESVGEQICVKFVLNAEAIAAGWLITEAHVAIADDETLIPQTKNGNPIPGQFEVNEMIDPGVTEIEYCLDIDGWTAPFAVAAHAKIELPEIGHMEEYPFCITSGTETGLVLGGDAAIAWGNPNPWDAQMQEDLNALADWIWDAQWVTPFVADEGGMVDFVQNFSIIGTPTSAELKIAADNAFAYSLNGGAETAENLAADWRIQAALGNFDWPGVVIDPNPSGWSQVYSYDVLGSLNSGTNTLNVTGVNADWNTTNPQANPAAVIYKLCGTYEEYVVDRPYDEESAWGGIEDFPGKNWATYINYTPIVCSTEYLLEFWAASSYPASPAQLQVKINGSVVGSTLVMPGTPGFWVQYSETWDAGAATSAIIEIRDLTLIQSGDDFVIDDISFVQQP